MAYSTVSGRYANRSPFAAIREALEGYRHAFMTYRRRRAIYLRTLRELQAYRPHELHDLRVQSADFEELARQQAGW
jgi:hypothetical protein